MVNDIERIMRTPVDELVKQFRPTREDIPEFRPNMTDFEQGFKSSAPRKRIDLRTPIGPTMADFEASKKKAVTTNFDYSFKPDRQTFEEGKKRGVRRGGLKGKLKSKKPNFFDELAKSDPFLSRERGIFEAGSGAKSVDKFKEKRASVKTSFDIFTDDAKRLPGAIKAVWKQVGKDIMKDPRRNTEAFLQGAMAHGTTMTGALSIYLLGATIKADEDRLKLLLDDRLTTNLPSVGDKVMKFAADQYETSTEWKEELEQRGISGEQALFSIGGSVTDVLTWVGGSKTGKFVIDEAAQSKRVIKEVVEDFIDDFYAAEGRITNRRAAKQAGGEFDDIINKNTIDSIMDETGVSSKEIEQAVVKGDALTAREVMTEKVDDIVNKNVLPDKKILKINEVVEVEAIVTPQDRLKKFIDSDVKLTEGEAKTANILKTSEDVTEGEIDSFIKSKKQSPTIDEIANADVVDVAKGKDLKQEKIPSLIRKLRTEDTSDLGGVARRIKDESIKIDKNTPAEDVLRAYEKLDDETLVRLANDKTNIHSNLANKELVSRVEATGNLKGAEDILSKVAVTGYKRGFQNAQIDFFYTDTATGRMTRIIESRTASDAVDLTVAQKGELFSTLNESQVLKKQIKQAEDIVKNLEARIGNQEAIIKASNIKNDIVRLRTKLTKVNKRVDKFMADKELFSDLEKSREEVVKIFPKGSIRTGKTELESTPKNWTNNTVNVVYKSFQSLANSLDAMGAERLGVELLAPGERFAIIKGQSAEKIVKKLKSTYTKEERKNAMSAFYFESGLTKSGKSIGSLTTKERKALKEIDGYIGVEGKSQGFAGKLDPAAKAEIEKLDFIPFEKKSKQQLGKAVTKSDIPGRIKFDPKSVPEDGLELDPVKFFQNFTAENANAVEYISRVKRLRNLVNDNRFSEIFGAENIKKLNSEIDSILKISNDPGWVKSVETLLGFARATNLLRPTVVFKQFLSMGDLALACPNATRYVLRKAPMEEALRGVSDPVFDFSNSAKAMRTALNVGLSPIQKTDKITRVGVYRGIYWDIINDLKRGGTEMTDEVMERAINTAWFRTQNLMGSTAPHQNPKMFKLPVVREMFSYLSAMNNRFNTLANIAIKAGNDKSGQIKRATISSGFVLLGIGEMLMSGLTIKELLVATGVKEEERKGDKRRILKSFPLNLARNIPVIATMLTAFNSPTAGFKKLQDIVTAVQRENTPLSKFRAFSSELFPPVENAIDVATGIRTGSVSVAGQSVPVDKGGIAKIAILGKNKLERSKRILSDIRDGKYSGLLKEDAQNVVNDQSDFVNKINVLIEEYGDKDDVLNSIESEMRNRYNIPASPTKDPPAFGDAMNKMSNEAFENYFQVIQTKTGKLSKEQIQMLTVYNLFKADPKNARKELVKWAKQNIEKELSEERKNQSGTLIPKTDLKAVSGSKQGLKTRSSDESLELKKKKLLLKRKRGNQ